MGSQAGRCPAFFKSCLLKPFWPQPLVGRRGKREDGGSVTWEGFPGQGWSRDITPTLILGLELSLMALPQCKWAGKWTPAGIPCLSSRPRGGQSVMSATHPRSHLISLGPCKGGHICSILKRRKLRLRNGKYSFRVAQHHMGGRDETQECVAHHTLVPPLGAAC